ncbi:MAG TPA: PHB depolymerase family esterase [Thermoanaerobaculia bacterium]|nr:PHB depolymerase family esterase [Thermoanaerobaculia bacterium]
MPFLRIRFAALLVALAAAAAAAEPEREIRLRSGGIERTCLVHAPAKTPARPMPLLLVLHGGGGTADGMIKLTKGGFDTLADGRGFVVGYPQGVGKSWTDGRHDLRSAANREHVDDVGFIRDLITELAGRYPVDRRRVFVAGMSNGGMMAMRLACSLPEVRGVAAVASSLSDDAAAKCPATSTVSVVEIAGTADPIVPYAGGEVKVLWMGRGEVTGAPGTAKSWAEKAGCRLVPEEAELPARVSDGTSVRKIEYPGCATGARVVLFRVEGGGHAWPGGLPYLSERMIGRTSGNLDACSAIWEIFSGLP